MHNILLMMIVFFFAGCESLQDLEAMQPKPVVIEPVKTTPVESESVKDEEKKIKMALAWGVKPEWDKYLSDAVNKKTISSDAKNHCKKVDIKECLMQAISIGAKYESSFKPDTSFKEDFTDSNGVAVISRGLMQISQESANQRAYACNIKDPKELHNPKVNLECAVNIAVYWINKDKVFFGYDSDNNKHLGLGRYWSVYRKKSKSQPKVLDYLKAF